MKQKKLFYYLFLILLLTAIGCKDDIVNPEATIEGRINAQKPMETIIIDDYESVSNDFIFKQNHSDESKKIRSAYAENGYFIVISGSGEKYNFNLTTVKNIKITKHRVVLSY